MTDVQALDQPGKRYPYEETSIIDEAFSSTKLITEMKNSLFEMQDWFQGRINESVGAADVLKSVRKIEAPFDSVAERLVKWTDAIVELNRIVEADLEKCFALVKDPKLFTKVIHPISILSDFMVNCFQNPGIVAYQNFNSVLQKYSPLKVTQDFVEYLKEKKTNPVILSMDAGEFHSIETWNEWMTIIERTLAYLMFIEAFARGYLNAKNQQSEMMSEISSLSKLMEEWKKDYKLPLDDRIFQNELYSFIRKFLRKNTNLNNAQKADGIAAQLSTYSTSDAFYVIVMDETNGMEDSSYHCGSHERLVEYCRDGNVVLVYRSHTANRTRPEDFKNIEKDVEACRNGKLFCNGTLENAIQEHILDKKLLSATGFVALAKKTLKPEIRSANCQEYKWGPGWWIQANMKDQKTDSSFPCNLIAAFD
ncbi:hypothetical protein CAEBREN_20404 [Caenorhabditis brenneri]|uniref:Uncharacterized protein n=1 Tax=Caenorhabditis brenneri TaxID=135651 RepID=G0P419_CAEBE|nr:hypothetical protein CAEBREN_20404 [Caenorhabditis brenneri]